MLKAYSAIFPIVIRNYGGTIFTEAFLPLVTPKQLKLLLNLVLEVDSPS